MNLMHTKSAGLGAVVCAVTILLTGTGCENNPASNSFVDDYTPPYTADEGTSIDGSYYPLIAGTHWRYDGTANMKGTMTVKAQGETMSEPLDETFPAYTDIWVLPQQSITVTSGTYTVFPVRESAVIEETGEATTSARYFENVDGTIYIRALQSADGTIVEVTDPIFIKHPLEVGDSWEATPSIGTDEILDLSGTDFSEIDPAFPNPDITMEIKCKFFVVGPETQAYNGSDVSSVRIDQRAEATVTMKFPSVGTLTIEMDIFVILNLVDNVGIIRTRDQLNMKMSGSLTFEGVTAAFSMDMDVDDDLKLTQYNEGSPTVSSLSKHREVHNRIQEKLAESDLTSKDISVILKTIELTKKSVF